MTTYPGHRKNRAADTTSAARLFLFLGNLTIPFAFLAKGLHAGRLSPDDNPTIYIYRMYIYIK